MHQTLLLLGVAIISLDLTSKDSSSKFDVLSQHCPSALSIFLSKDCLICESTTQVSDRFIPGEQLSELELLRQSSCNISPILDNMLNAKFPRTLE
jgi:hypothetical protein